MTDKERFCEILKATGWVGFDISDSPGGGPALPPRSVCWASSRKNAKVLSDRKGA